MRTKPDKFQHARLFHLLVNQQQIRFDVTFPVVFPCADKGVITVAFGQELILNQKDEDGL
jgi:hypothetical protein